MNGITVLCSYYLFANLSELIEFGNTEEVFNNPAKEKTSEYITGRFG